jgi:pyocin large subunit-like protein
MKMMTDRAEANGKEHWSQSGWHLSDHRQSRDDKLTDGRRCGTREVNNYLRLFSSAVCWTHQPYRNGEENTREGNKDHSYEVHAPR